MKEPKILLFFVVLFFACSPQTNQKEVPQEHTLRSQQIRKIHLEEKAVVRTMRAYAKVNSKDLRKPFQNIPLTTVPVSGKTSYYIIITDTIGYSPSGGEVTPSPAGVNIVIDANIQPGDYYCQSYNNGKMTCERGSMGLHLHKNQLTTIATYSASDHFASAAYRNEILIFKELSGGSINEVASHSTVGRTVCVYNENGNLIVATKN